LDHENTTKNNKDNEPSKAKQPPSRRRNIIHVLFVVLSKTIVVPC
jgi:hypothetical protein